MIMKKKKKKILTVPIDIANLSKVAFDIFYLPFGIIR